MSVEDIGDYLWILITSGTLVVNDDIITFGPVSILEEIERGINGLVCSPDDVDTYIGAALQAFRDDFVLLSVIVAATAGDQQGFEGLGGRGVGNEASWLRLGRLRRCKRQANE